MWLVKAEVPQGSSLSPCFLYTVSLDDLTCYQFKFQTDIDNLIWPRALLGAPDLHWQLPIWIVSKLANWVCPKEHPWSLPNIPIPTPSLFHLSYSRQKPRSHPWFLFSLKTYIQPSNPSSFFVFANPSSLATKKSTFKIHLKSIWNNYWEPALS